jgi:hypothetical protein
MKTLEARTKSGIKLQIIPQNQYVVNNGNGSQVKLTSSSFCPKDGRFYLRVNQYQVKTLLGINVNGDSLIEIVTPNAESIIQQQYEDWREERLNILRLFREDVIAGNIRLKIIHVGSEYPQAVLHIDNDYKGIKAFDVVYSLGQDIYDAFRWIPREMQINGVDVTEQVAQKLMEKKLEEKRYNEKLANIESGCIYFHCESSQHNDDVTNVILNQPAPSDGSFTLEQKISDVQFARIKNFGRYYSADFLEDCDMFNSLPGWRFSKHAIDELLKTNRVFINDSEIQRS